MLEYGFTVNSLDKLIIPSLLSVLTTIIFFKPKLRRYAIFIIGACLVLMIIFNIFNLASFANILGEFGFSLLLVSIFLYLPQIIKKGYIEKV